MQSVFVEAREWFDRVNGNSYYSARVYVDGELIETTGLTYGYESAYEYEAARILHRHGLIPDEYRERSVRWLKDLGVHVYTVKYDTGKRELWRATV